MTLPNSPRPGAVANAVRWLNDGVSRAVDVIARLSFWRFVLLCVLLMIAAGMADDLLERRPHRPAIHITKDTPPVAKVPASPTPETPAPPDDDAAAGEAAGQEPHTDGDKSASDAFEIRIDENGVFIKGRGNAKDLEKLGAAIEKEVANEMAKDAEQEHGIDASFSLPTLAALIIVLMLILRLIAKSKVRAEERAASAEVAADTADLSRQLAEAKLQAMQAQVEPHFLFNTLAAVEHLIETDPPRAAAMQRNLIAYLRSVLPNLRQADSTLGREVDIARNYLEILKYRMESRLEVTISVPSGLESAAMPPLMLQSLVENAIQHGLEPLPEGGRIAIDAQIHDGKLRVVVADTGSGFTTDGKSQRPGNGVGLSSIRERLAALFGDQGRLIIEANTPRGTRITLEFPYAYQPNGARADR